MRIAVKESNLGRYRKSDIERRYLGYCVTYFRLRSEVVAVVSRHKLDVSAGVHTLSIHVEVSVPLYKQAMAMQMGKMPQSKRDTTEHVEVKKITGDDITIPMRVFETITR